MYEFVIKGSPAEIMNHINEVIFANEDTMREDGEQAQRSELEHLAELDGVTEEDTKDLY